MIWNFEKMYAVLATMDHKLLLNGKWGVEREFQRVAYSGDLALTPHPKVFDDKLKNKEITTDFAESQIELITPAFSNVEEVDHYLKYLHQKVEAELGNEYMWPLSMPPRLPEEGLIPIAQFDDSEEGRTAYLYRQGLANRYGKKMQMISGIHFNFSFGEELMMVLKQEFGENMQTQEFIDELYFAVARNFLRYRWLLIYLFGASPTHDDTYDIVMKAQVENIRRCCPECCKEYEKYATSLRVSRFGYSNPAKGRSSELYNSKYEYIHGIRQLMSKKSNKFAKLGTQLNNNILQKDSEFYSPIRLKQITEPHESQIDALEKRGVKYAEVRILDVNPFEKTGISLEQMHFLQVFMLFCLFEENKPMDNYELNRINKNHHLVALSGRKPGLKLNHLSGGKINMKEWANSIFNKLRVIASLLDQEENGYSYSKSVQQKVNVYAYRKSVQMEYQKLMDPSLLPSGVIQEEMDRRQETFIDFGMRMARGYKTDFVKEERKW